MQKKTKGKANVRERKAAATTPAPVKAQGPLLKNRNLGGMTSGVGAKKGK